jgi:hypothetical protein
MHLLLHFPIEEENEDRWSLAPSDRAGSVLDPFPAGQAERKEQRQRVRVEYNETDS